MPAGVANTRLPGSSAVAVLKIDTGKVQGCVSAARTVRRGVDVDFSFDGCVHVVNVNLSVFTSTVDVSAVSTACRREVTSDKRLQHAVTDGDQPRPAILVCAAGRPAGTAPTFINDTAPSA